MWKIGLLSASFLLAAWGNGLAEAADTKLPGGEWVLAGTGERAPYLRFSPEGKVAGSSGCNRFAGTYQIAGEKLSFSPLAATKMACPPAVMAVEQAFFAMLGEVSGVKLDANRAVLLDAGGKELGVLQRRGD